jgi:hypothetical protein
VIAAAVPAAWLTLGAHDATAVEWLSAPVHGYRVRQDVPHDPQTFSQSLLYADVVFELPHLAYADVARKGCANGLLTCSCHVFIADSAYFAGLQTINRDYLRMSRASVPKTGGRGRAILPFPCRPKSTISTLTRCPAELLSGYQGLSAAASDRLPAALPRHAYCVISYIHAPYSPASPAEDLFQSPLLTNILFD